MKQLIIACILLLVVVIFAVQNSDQVIVTFISWELKMSMALLLLLTLFIGLIIGLLFNAPKLLKNRNEINRLKKLLNNKNVSV